MLKPKSKKTPLHLFERYELKFSIPLEMMDRMCRFCDVYCRPDAYSENNPSGFYAVNSLYLDTPNFLFFHKRVDGSENRFNMRIRTYGRAATPCFLEIKQKRSNIVTKYRARMMGRRWLQMFENGQYPFDEKASAGEASKARLFYRLAYTHNVGPVVLTAYQRRAYESLVDEYARVTFDRDMVCQPAEGYRLIPDERMVFPYDHATLFEPEQSVVLELKCHSARVPYWMIDMIRCFDLQRRSFSKYVYSLTEALGRLDYDHSNRCPCI